MLQHIFRPTLVIGLALLVATPGTASLLPFVEAQSLPDPAPGICGRQVASVATSFDGLHVYAAAPPLPGSLCVGTPQAALMAFERNPSTGELNFLAEYLDNENGINALDNVASVVVSPDGNSVYTASAGDSAVAAFARDPITGLLTFVDAEFQGVGDVDALTNAHMVSISPNGRHVYAASPGNRPSVPGGIAVFERNMSTGELTPRQDFMASGTYDYLNGLVSVEISPDPTGSHAYAAAFRSDSLTTLRRDDATGELSFVEVHSGGQFGVVVGLDGVNEVAVSPNGRQVYAVSIDRLGVGEDALVTFDRDTTTGQLTFKDAQLGDDDWLDAAGLGDAHAKRQVALHDQLGK